MDQYLVCEAQLIYNYDGGYRYHTKPFWNAFDEILPFPTQPFLIPSSILAVENYYTRLEIGPRGGGAVDVLRQTRYTTVEKWLRRCAHVSTNASRLQVLIVPSARMIHLPRTRRVVYHEVVNEAIVIFCLGFVFHELYLQEGQIFLSA